MGQLKSMQEELAQLRARGAEVKTLESEIDQLRKRSARKSAMISKAYVYHTHPSPPALFTHTRQKTDAEVKTLESEIDQHRKRSVLNIFFFGSGGNFDMLVAMNYESELREKNAELRKLKEEVDFLRATNAQHIVEVSKFITSK